MDISANYGAVIAAAISNMIIGALWYSPLLFGKQWAHLSGMTHEDMERAKKRGMGKSYAAMFVAALVMAYVFAHFANTGRVFDVSGAWRLAFWVWFGFIATVGLGSILWERKSWKLYAINMAYWFVSLFAMALIIAFWK